ncbi:MAG: hypothetical protein IJO72_06750 [Oscillospiraceae bacterium]|nr:hypothetical protein [Oscillospiraceae bacterium]MBQ9930454.1 hypothetical protein [Oscillospiraceae bacterium]
MKRLSPGVRFLLGLVTFILCVALFFATVAGILVANVVQIVSSQDNLENLLRQVLFVDMLRPASTRNAPLGSAPALRKAPVRTLSPADIRLAEPSDATSIVEWVYDALSEDFGDELQVDLDTVKEFVERSTLDDYLVEKGAGLISDVFTGESTVTLGADEIKAKIEENADLIEEYFGIAVDMQVVEDVTTIIEDNEYVARLEEEGIVNVLMNPDGNSYPDGEENPNNADQQMLQQALDTGRQVLSVTTVIACAVSILLLIALILLTNMKQIWVGMNKIGITLMLAALPFVALTVAVWVIPAGWAGLFALPAITEIAVNALVGINYIICFGVFALGLALLIAGIVTYCVVRSRRKKAQTLAQLEEAVMDAAPLPAVEFPVEEAAEEAEEAAAADEEAADEVAEAETSDGETAETV